MTTRRQFVLGASTFAVLGLSSPAFAMPHKRLVLVILRGGLDGLAALVPHGDRSHRRVRGDAAVLEALDLDGFYGLNPALEPLLPLWRAGQLAPVTAVGLPWSERSHFSAQDLLEAGTDRHTRDGWLSRALARAGGEGLAIGKGLPLVLRGEGEATSFEPKLKLKSEQEFLAEVATLYDADPILGPPFRKGLETRMELDALLGEARKGRSTDLTVLRTLAALLREPDGPAVAVVEVGGWDTHSQQENRLRNGLGALAEGLVLLSEELRERWADTMVVAVSEFGRTVRANGTGGTDHGTGGAALVAGGSVAGGRVLGGWPGLDDLFEGRDLPVTTDVRSLFKGAIQAQLGLGPARLDEVFPDSAGALPLRL